MEEYIVIQPEFIFGNIFSLSLSCSTIEGKLGSYDLGKEEGEEFIPLFSPFIMKMKSGNYRLFFSGRDVLSKNLEAFSTVSALSDLAPWLEDTHFYIYYETPRFTFETLNIITVIIKDGKLTYTENSFKHEIPSSIFLALTYGGVQQDFCFIPELLFAKKEIWINNDEIKEFLIDDCLLSIENRLKGISGREVTHKWVDYLSFGENETLDRLSELGYSFSDNNNIKKLLEIHSDLRNTLLEQLNEKITPTGEKASLKNLNEIEAALNISLPLTFKRIYSEICNGGFGPYVGFLPLDKKIYSIKNLTILLRRKANFPAYLIPFAYLGKSTYACINTSTTAFPVINFYRKPKDALENWYDAYDQTCNSFEEWLSNWIDEIFTEIYEI